MSKPMDFNARAEAQAFPTAFNAESGMTLRDYFAAKAMQTIIGTKWYERQNKAYSEIGQHIASDAYVIADAMLAEREKDA